MADAPIEIAGKTHQRFETSPGSGIYLTGVHDPGTGLTAAAVAGSDLVNDLLIVRQRSGWSTPHVPAVNTKATITKAAGGVGIKHVCTGITVAITAGAVAPAAIVLDINLIDGASGGVNYLWRSKISLTAVPGQMSPINLPGLWLEGSYNTGMTLEFSAAGGANTFESVTLMGVSIQ